MKSIGKIMHFHPSGAPSEDRILLIQSISMARRRFLRTLKSRLVVAVLLCFICIGLPSLVALYRYMNGLVFDQVARVNRNWVADAAGEVNRSLDAVIEAVSWICFNENVKSAMGFDAPLTSGETLAVFAAQDSLSAYMAGSPAWDDMNKIVVFNEDGVSFTFTKNRYGTLSDVDILRLRDEYRSVEYDTGSYVKLMFSQTLNSPYEDAVVAYGRMDDMDAYVYAEVDMGVFDPLFEDALVDGLYIVGDDGAFIWPSDPEADMLDSSSYASESIALSIPGASIVHFENRTPVGLGSAYGLGAFVMLLAGSTVLFAVVSVIISRFLTRSTDKLVDHMGHLAADNAFGEVDPSIEEGDDEIARVGRTVNSMSLSIAELLERNEKLNEEKRETELSMLQMQVNPHFLYNTLESIHYLAKIQKAEGIASMSRGLSHLLKNMAKGNGERIRLSDELELVREYDEIQQVRYMGMYDIVYAVPEEHMDLLIQKFTLQPLIENAIFHGIEPTGGCGTITVSSRIDGDHLVVSVADDGVGMDEAELERVFEPRQHFKGNMTGVGIRNIDERIRLYYGEGCGLSFTSHKGRGTVASVRILLEREVT